MPFKEGLLQNALIICVYFKHLDFDVNRLVGFFKADYICKYILYLQELV